MPDDANPMAMAAEDRHKLLDLVRLIFRYLLRMFSHRQLTDVLTEEAERYESERHYAAMAVHFPKSQPPSEEE